MVQANRVWDANNDGVLDTGAPTGEGIKVCVIDSGMDPQHPELKAAFAGGKDFVDDDDDPDATRTRTGNVGRRPRHPRGGAPSPRSSARPAR